MNTDARAEVTSAPPTQDVEAYGLYLQAQAVESRYTDESLRRAVELYSEALARDPHFARAWTARAGTRLGQILLGYPLHPALEDAERDVNEALSLEPNLPRADSVLGQISAYRGDWLRAEASFRTASAAGPADPDTLVDHVIYVLQSAGQLRQAHSDMTEASRLAPADAYVVMNLAAAKSLLGLDAEAVRVADLAADLAGWPANVTPLPEIRRNAAVRNGHYADAAEQMVNALPVALRNAGGADTLRLVYSAVAEPSKRPAARQALQALVRRIGPDVLTSTTRETLIIEFNSIGALDEAYELASDSLDGFARSGIVGTSWGGLWLPEMRPFRTDPRFQSFVTRPKRNRPLKAVLTGSLRAD